MDFAWPLKAALYFLFSSNRIHVLIILPVVSSFKKWGPLLFPKANKLSFHLPSIRHFGLNNAKLFPVWVVFRKCLGVELLVTVKIFFVSLCFWNCIMMCLCLPFCLSAPCFWFSEVLGSGDFSFSKMWMFWYYFFTFFLSLVLPSSFVWDSSYTYSRPFNNIL